MYQKTVLSKGIPENISFKLKKTVGQDNFKILYMGDKHLANRSQDILQYKKFLADVTAYKGSHSSEKIYAITLAYAIQSILSITTKCALPILNEYHAGAT